MKQYLSVNSLSVLPKVIWGTRGEVWIQTQVSDSKTQLISPRTVSFQFSSRLRKGLGLDTLNSLQEWWKLWQKKNKRKRRAKGENCWVDFAFGTKWKPFWRGHMFLPQRRTGTVWGQQTQPKVPRTQQQPRRGMRQWGSWGTNFIERYYLSASLHFIQSANSPTSKGFLFLFKNEEILLTST